MFNSKGGDLTQTQKMSSQEIAQITGKLHKNILRDIRNQEDAWQKVSGLKFELAKYTDAQGKPRKQYLFNKLECIYIISKYDDETRAKLVKRWYELENQKTPYALPRKTVKGITRLPYSDSEKEVIDFVRKYLIEGDYAKIGKQTGYSKATISLVLNGKHVNHRILKESYRVAVDNQIQQKGRATTNYDIDFINDALQTIKKLSV